MPQYKITHKDPIKVNGKRQFPGDIVEMTEDQALSFLDGGYCEPLKKQQAHSEEKPASATQEKKFSSTTAPETEPEPVFSEVEPPAPKAPRKKK